MGQTTNRRRFERFAVRPMYTPIAVRLLSEREFSRLGHAYDVSEGGAQFELDDPIAPGTPVEIRLALPADDGGGEDEHTVTVRGNVVWVSQDADEPGPVRLAAAFQSFEAGADRARLLGVLSSGRYARAA
ncbi:MAG: PilZ domain-containing protein [Phycisphaerales bacterium]